MKKTVICFTAAILLIASCKKDEDLAIPNEPKKLDYLERDLKTDLSDSTIVAPFKRKTSPIESPNNSIQNEEDDGGKGNGGGTTPPPPPLVQTSDIDN